MFRNKKMVKNTSYHHALPFIYLKGLFWRFQAHIIHNMTVFRLFLLFFWHKFGISYHIINFKRHFRWYKLLNFIIFNTRIVHNASFYTRNDVMGMGTNLEKEPIGEEHGWSGVGEATGRREVVREERRRKWTDVTASISRYRFIEW